MNPIGILGAIPEEILVLKNYLQNPIPIKLGGRVFYTGELFGKNVVIVFSRWGKVAAASTATALILEFKVSEILFCGVAGGIQPSVKRGDLVIGNALIQHDLDPRPIMPRWEIPMTGITRIPIEEYLIVKLEKTLKRIIQKEIIESFIPLKELQRFDIDSPKIHIGLIASGDQFFHKVEQAQQLRNDLPNVLCVEMEGAAVGQVCLDYKIPYSIIRTISDNANEMAHNDFQEFIACISEKYTLMIVKTWLELHP